MQLSRRQLLCHTGVAAAGLALARGPAAADRRPRFVKVSAIACIRGADDYAEIILDGGETSLVHRPLKDWEARLPDKRFARIHRTVIVNLDFVERVERVRDEQYQVIVRGLAEPLPMSRRHAARLKLELG